MRDDDSLGWLFSGDRPRCMLLLGTLVAKDAPDVQTALTEFFVAIVGDFYSLDLTRLRMKVDPRRFVYAYIAVMTNEAAKAKLLAEYCGDGRPGIVIGGLLQMLLDSAAVNDVLTINAKMVRDGETGGCLLS